jgi:2-succinyl-5-enolpyruvyl-6-hydroxy-3-cyclohexene-1-carboxylate synthase
VGAALDAVLDETDAVLTEPRVARDVADLIHDDGDPSAGAALVVASSMPIRDLDLTMRPRTGLRIVANRGVSGIDGFVSTAQGVALAHPGATYALAGDLSLLHDVNGLLGVNGSLAGDRPDLTMVVVNNDGGGIFSTLEQAAVPAPFERVFGTPHRARLAGLAAAAGIGHTVVTRAADLPAVLKGEGIRVVEVPADRAAGTALRRRLAEAAAAAIAALP